MKITSGSYNSLTNRDSGAKTLIGMVGAFVNLVVQIYTT